MDHLWSPWRMKYIRRKRIPEGCIFCNAGKKGDTDQHLVVTRGEYAFVILNRYPYTSGHMMVVPYKHIGKFDDLTQEMYTEIMFLTGQGIAALEKVYQPEGFNLGSNLGSAAGAGITGHIHFHIVPRWKGDTNFMTSTGSTRVLPEDLSETLTRLRDAWPNESFSS